MQKNKIFNFSFFFLFFLFSFFSFFFFFFFLYIFISFCLSVFLSFCLSVFISLYPSTPTALSSYALSQNLVPLRTFVAQYRRLSIVFCIKSGGGRKIEGKILLTPLPIRASRRILGEDDRHSAAACERTAGTSSWQAICWQTGSSRKSDKIA